MSVVVLTGTRSTRTQVATLRLAVDAPGGYELMSGALADHVARDIVRGVRGKTFSGHVGGFDWRADGPAGG